MNKASIQQHLFSILGKIAPEIDPATIDTSENIQEEFEIDSMDFWRVVVAIDEQYGISIPESDHARISTIDTMVEYIEGKI